MQIDKQKFMDFLKTGVNKSLNASQKEKDFVFKKGEELIDLMKELEDKGFLRKLTKDYIKEIDKLSDVTTKNIEELSQLSTTFMGIIRNNTGFQGTHISLKDNINKEYEISAHQIAIVIGVTYSLYCEYNRFWFFQIIDFEKMKDRKRNKARRPSGIGALCELLKTNGLTKLNFFGHVDSKLRNAFSHLNFKFDGMLVNYGDNYEHSIALDGLLRGAFDLDRSGLALMYACRFYFHFSQL